VSYAPPDVAALLGRGGADALGMAALPMYFLDASGRIDWMNHRAIEFFGDLVGQPYTAAIAARSHDVARETFTKKVSSGVPETHEDGYARRADGSELLARFHAITVYDEGKQAVGVFGVVDTDRSNPACAGEAAASKLTPREREILVLMSQGYGTRRIAEKLHIQEVTVRNHTSRILGKMGVNSKLAAITTFLTGRAPQ